MPEIVGIRFKKCGRVYNFEVNGAGEELRKGDCVVVESELGMCIGRVVIEKHTIENPDKELRPVLRKATEEDIKQRQDNETFEKEAKGYCLERIMARGLPMKLICTEATLDRKRIIFYFTADGRIDFREIVKDLAARFKTRIEMRQIGVRDEAKIVGGFGMCGRELCCKTFLTSFEPISIKMAKQQDLVLNMSKLSGICGRLMCCLSYEISDEITDEAAEVPVKEVSVVDEPEVLQDVVEDAPQPAIEQQTTQKESQQPEIAAKDAGAVVSDKPASAEGDNKDISGQRHEHYGHRKRKRWRWRKFHKKQ